MPLIVAGLRLAAVSTIALVTVTSVLGDSFGGLGFFILEGYRRSFPLELYVGAFASILLAFAVDALLVAARATDHAVGSARYEATRRSRPRDAHRRHDCVADRPGQLERSERHPGANGRAHRHLGRLAGDRSRDRVARRAVHRPYRPRREPRDQHGQRLARAAVPRGHRDSAADHGCHRPAGRIQDLPDGDRHGRPGRAADPGQRLHRPARSGSRHGRGGARPGHERATASRARRAAAGDCP